MNAHVLKARQAVTAVDRNLRRLTVALGVMGGLVGVVAPACARVQPGEAAIAGVWSVTRHGVDCQTGQVLSSFPAIMAFASDGSLTSYGLPPGSSPALASPEFGNWKRQGGPGHFAFRLLSFNYDASGAFSGSTQVTAQSTVGDGATSLSYTSTVQFFDASGVLLFQVCGAATGTRFGSVG